MYTTQYSSRKSSGPKCKNNEGEKNENPGPAPKKANATKRMRGKHDGKKGKLAQRALTVARKNTSLVIALSQRRYSLT